METIKTTNSQANIRFSIDELGILNQALNEVCNGITVLDFEQKIGVSREQAYILLKSVGALIDQMDLIYEDLKPKKIIAHLTDTLDTWIYRRRLGTLASTAGEHIISNIDLRNRDIRFVSAKRMEHMRRNRHTFADTIPNLIIQVKLSTDSIKALQAQIQKLLELGTQVGILVDPEQLTVTVYHPTDQPIVLMSEDTLTIPELLPGWELKLLELWLLLE